MDDVSGDSTPRDASDCYSSPVQSRRAQLEEWKRAKAANGGSGGSSNSSFGSPNTTMSTGTDTGTGTPAGGSNRKSGGLVDTSYANANANANAFSPTSALMDRSRVPKSSERKSTTTTRAQRTGASSSPSGNRVNANGTTRHAGTSSPHNHTHSSRSSSNNKASTRPARVGQSSRQSRSVSSNNSYNSEFENSTDIHDSVSASTSNATTPPSPTSSTNNDMDTTPRKEQQPLTSVRISKCNDESKQTKTEQHTKSKQPNGNKCCTLTTFFPWVLLTNVLSYFMGTSLLLTGGSAAISNSTVGKNDDDKDHDKDANDDNNAAILELQQDHKIDRLTTQLNTISKERDALQSVHESTLQELETKENNVVQLQQNVSTLNNEKENMTETMRVLQEQLVEYHAFVDNLRAVSLQLEKVTLQSKQEVQILQSNHQHQVEKLKLDVRVLVIQQQDNELILRDGKQDKKEERDLSNDDGLPGQAGNEKLSALARAYLEERQEKITVMEQQLLQGVQLRKTMHNRIQELRGNIRVFVRIRPLSKIDRHLGKGEYDDSVLNTDQSLPSPISLVPQKEDSICYLKNGRYDEQDKVDFHFDKVFGASAAQENVFAEVSEFVQSALDGYRVCLFAYGQTGSGKTHTMVGSGTTIMRGIIPRAVEQILTHAKALSSDQHQPWEITLSASFLEIYNEELRDLLIGGGLPLQEDNHTGRSSSSSTTTTTTAAATMPDKPTKLFIKKDATGSVNVSGLVQSPINTADKEHGLQQLDEIMKVAARNRSVACTKMNVDSSRSHSVFLLHLWGKNLKTGTILRGALNLCDLAGSERLSRTNHDVSTAEGSKRLKETQAINKSLSTLGDVFHALASGSSFVPYRNSKLTYLLQDCLGGDGKALMMVNLSPTVESGSESLCSLRFAQRVNQIELGKATKNVQCGKQQTS